MTLVYDSAASPQYNGNIAEFDYQTDHVTNGHFAYSYDQLNRLEDAVYTPGGGLNEALTYDKAGNITQIVRGGTGNGTLNFTYKNSGKSNQLFGVSGYRSGSFGYDVNGNLTSDGTKGLTFAYNLLNLPATVSGSQTASYVYDASGNKLRSVRSGMVHDYVDGIHYTGANLEFISTVAGKAVNENGTYKYEYNLADHLGNVRVTIDDNNGSPRVIQEDEYYAFGLSRPKYLFGAKPSQ